MAPSNPTLALTYKDDGNQDGICSQLLRIYGIYAISRFLGVPYVHSPIAHLGYHGLTALENNAPLPDLLPNVNRVFQIPSDVELIGRPIVIHDMIDADIESIEMIKRSASPGGPAHLVKILYPFPVTDSKPEIYRHLKSICPFPYRRSEVFRLAIHVRRGECLAVATDWLLPNSYYVSCALRFQRVLRELHVPFVCELYTEVPTKRFEVTPHHHGIGGRIAQNMTFDPTMNHVEDFDVVPHLRRFINADPIESLRRMTTADALIISHSSFSYLPAILNPDSIVIYHPYWRSRLTNWLSSDDKGVFPEDILINRLKTWKRAGDRNPRSTHSRPSAAALPGDFDAEIKRLLKPFEDQSAAIRSVVAVGCYCIPRVTADVGPMRLAVGEGRVGPAVPLGSTESTLDGLASHVRALFGSSTGDDLLLVPLDVLNDRMAPRTDEFGFRAVAVLMTGSTGYDEQDWRARRSLFDRGLVCIGSADIAGSQALCFLRSDSIRSFTQLDVESRGHVTMSNLLDGAGFGNQLWRYTCVKLYALRHGLTPAVPAWQGNQLFGLQDASSEGFDFPRISYPGFAKNDRELWDRDNPPFDMDLDGYFQEIPECWRKHRDLLRNMFQLSHRHLEAMDAWRDTVTDHGRRTLVAVSVRRGDYYRLQTQIAPWFRLVPEQWYLDWLRTIWPSLRDPMLFVTSDDRNRVAPLFLEFEPVPADYGPVIQELPRHVIDFEVLRRADYMALCNSSFPRFAAILAPATQRCFLPSFRTGSFVPYEPWMDPAFWERFEDASGLGVDGGSPPFEGVNAVTVRPGLYVPTSSCPSVCVYGWSVAESSGVRPSLSTATLQFRADALVGTRIQLVLRLSTYGRDFRIRIESASGTDTEVPLMAGSTGIAVLAAVVEPGNLVTANLTTMGGLAEEQSPEGPYWMLTGILYFVSEHATRES